jgi:hypothetical protein
MMSAMTRTARRMFELLEPICLVTYFADECNEELARSATASTETVTSPAAPRRVAFRDPAARAPL